MIDIGFKLALAYALGSVMGSLLIGRLRKVDIRTVGSGNAGSTNALRTQGPWFALAVLAIDVGKGALAAGWVPTLTWVSAATVPAWLPYACAAASVLGHVFPFLFGFRGGKGAATLMGTLFVFDASLVLPLLGVFIAVIALSGYVGLATMVTANAAALAILLVHGASRPEFLAYAVVMGIAMLLTHHSNIRRMMTGTESRNTRLMVLRR